MQLSRVSSCLLCVIAVTIVPALAQDPFERGPEILFTDGLEGEKLGEFPSRWRLVSGRAETAAQRGGTVLSFRTTRTGVKPYMETVAYLPDSFTLEFEYLVNHATQHSYEVQFLDEAGLREASVRLAGRRYVLVSAQGRTISDSPTPDAADHFSPDWRRFALSYNEGELRAFCNEERVLNVPDFRAALRSFVILGGRPANAQPNADTFIRNVVVAAGGMPLYRRVMTEGKFVTTGIQFDVGKADLKPESMPVIEQVFEMMKAHAELRFSVEGHTDSDGDAALNQTLSGQRAESVVRQLVSMGIAAERLSARGWGASKPVAANTTPEGKRQNRRVEFVKQ